MGNTGGATPTDKMVRFHSFRLLLLHHPQIISRSLFFPHFSQVALVPFSSNCGCCSAFTQRACVL